MVVSKDEIKQFQRRKHYGKFKEIRGSPDK